MKSWIRALEFQNNTYLIFKLFSVLLNKFGGSFDNNVLKQFFYKIKEKKYTQNIIDIFQNELLRNPPVEILLKIAYGISILKDHFEENAFLCVVKDVLKDFGSLLQICFGLIICGDPNKMMNQKVS